MKERTITFLIAGTVVILFGILFLAQYLIFFSPHPNFVELLEAVAKYSVDQDWNRAESTINKVQGIWIKGNPVIAIKYAESDFSVLNVALIRLKAAIITKDIPGVIREATAAELLFKNITSITPKP
jgi:hypothetical protein